MKKTDLLFSSSILLTSITSLILANINPVLFFEFVKEDGVVENLTAIFLLAVSVSFLILLKNKNLGKVGLCLSALAFFFAFGEEISWGQRIFNFSSNSFFQENNTQYEANIHNLEINGIRLNKIIFTQILGVIFGIYFLVFPILNLKNERFNSFMNKVGILIPRILQSMVFVVATILISIIYINHPEVDDAEKWEVWELLFALTFTWICWQSANHSLRLK